MDAVGICNLALGQLAANRITSLDDNVTEAKLMKDLFVPTRDALMAAHWWTFAVARLTLAADVDDPAFEWEHQFTLPSTVLAVLRCDDGSGTFDLQWQREGDKIVANIEGPLYAQVLQRVDDVAAWSPGFCTALAFQLAADACIALNENGTQYERLVKLAQMKTREALLADGRQGRAEVVRGPRLSRVR
jgi:hypothetical protein